MSKLVAIIFPDEEKISDITRALRNMNGGKGIKLFGSAVVVRDAGRKSVGTGDHEGRPRRHDYRRFNRRVGGRTRWSACGDHRGFGACNFR